MTADAPDPPATETPASAARSHRARFVAAAVVIAVIAVGLFLYIRSTAGIAGTVRLASNVRPGPGVSYRAVAVLPAGTRVRVDCQVSGWAKLHSPDSGDFVFETRLTLSGAPPRC